MMLAFSLLAIACVVGLAVLAWLRSGRRWRVAVVECLRVLMVVLAVALLWQPESIYRVRSDRKAEVIVLVDHSESMQTRDVRSGATWVKRQEVADRVSVDESWSRLDSRFERIVDAFADEIEAGTDIAAGLDRAAARHPSAVGFLVVSDGDWNQGRSPVEAVADLRTRSSAKASVYSVPTGGVDRLPDIELVTADVPTFGVVGKPVRIPYTIRNWFSQTREVNLSLRVGDRSVQQRTILIPGGGRDDGAFVWQSDQAGNDSLSVDVQVIDGETNTDNNRLERSIEIRAEKLRVLIVESTPRWEYRYLRNALLRDPGIDVACLLFHPGLDTVGGGGTDYLKSMPDDAAEWASFDVIFLGDVGVRRNQLSLEDCRQIRGLVEQQAVGLVVMPGRRGGQASLLQSDLGDLIPVVLDAGTPRGVGSEASAGLSLTRSGRKSLLTRLVDDTESNWNVWESLPGFSWHAAVTRAKAGSDVLAVHAETGNEFGRLPLLVTRPAGAGKVLFMGTDAAWRWRMGVEDKYHYRFWGQVIRWMAYQRNMAVGETMRLSYRPEQPQTGETVSFRASVMTGRGSPSEERFVDLEIVSPQGERNEIRLARTDAEWGVFVGQAAFDRIGEYALKLTHPSEDSKIQTRLMVQGGAVEQVGRPSRPDVMREIARVGGGQTFAVDQIGELVEQFNAMPPDPSEIRRIEWWNHPAVLLGLVGGLSLFWIGRKWAGGV